LIPSRRLPDRGDNGIVVLALPGSLW
jgi:hypothetical protein